jgi:hypothetical protein
MELLMEKTEISNPESEQTSRRFLVNSFTHFFFYAWSVAVRNIEGKFLTPDHLAETCYRLQFKKKTSTVGPRFHLKSTVLEAYLAWKLLRMEHFYNEWEFMSFTGDLAEYHTKRVKRHIQALPQLFGDYEDLTNAESIMHYSHNGRIFFCEPSGVFSFKRGKHPNGLLCDDILKDPQVKLDIGQLEKIATAFFEEIESMPKEELHILGTPQDEEDLFTKLECTGHYDCKRYDAIVDEANHKTWWPRLFDWDELERRRKTIGDKAFLKEFRARPVRGADSYFSLQEINDIIKPRLKNYTLTDSVKLNGHSYGGFDIGKKTHPSHLSVLKPDRKGRLVQLHSKWFDGVDYKDQIAYLKEAIKHFHMGKLFFDNTRAEFEGFAERGELPAEMEGMVFGAKSKFQMGADLDKQVTNRRIMLVADDRQKRQILRVDNDLDAVQSAEGHGDSFFSLCLAIQAWLDGSGILVWSPQ